MLLPLETEDFKGHSSAGIAAALYLRRMLRVRHMDFDHTLWLMLNLWVAATAATLLPRLPVALVLGPLDRSHLYSSLRCCDPRRVYRSATYHRGTKNQWARDDPAFVVLLVYLLLISVVAWSIGFGRCVLRSPSGARVPAAPQTKARCTHKQSPHT